MVTEAQFIGWGLKKDQYPVSVKEIEDLLNKPELLDTMQDVFLEQFYYYHTWYWNNQRSK